MHETRKKTDIGGNGQSTGDSVPENLPKHLAAHLDPISRVTVVLPLHNEADNIKSVCLELLSALSEAGYIPRILLINDGSTDGSEDVCWSLSEETKEIEFISFSRNFGKEAALMAGLIESGDNFDVLAYMDSDGQHAPSDLVTMLRTMQALDVDLVCGARSDRDYQTGAQKWMARQFYNLFHALTDQRIEEGVGDFNVLRPKVVEALRQLREEHPFMKGLVAWVGFRRVLVPITIRPRAGGAAKSSTRKMLRLAAGAFLSFSSWPLRAWSVIGMASACLSIVFLLLVIVQTVFFGREVPGYATTVVLLLGLGGLQLFSIGVLGEYVARIYDASKRRPRYIISQRRGK